MSSLKIWGLGLIALGLMGTFGVHKRLIAMQSDIQARVDTALALEGIDDVEARVDGQSVNLSLKAGATPPDGRTRLRDAKTVILNIDNGLPKAYTDVNLPELGDRRLSLSGRGGLVFGPVTKVAMSNVTTVTRMAPVLTAVDEASTQLERESLPAATGRAATALADDVPQQAATALSAGDVATDIYGPQPVKAQIPEVHAASTDYHGADAHLQSSGLVQTANPAQP